MSTSDPTVQESTADATVPERAKDLVVGIDSENAKHLFDWYKDTLYVVADCGDGDVTHVVDLAPNKLPRWIDHTREARGWWDCRYGSMIQRLADAVAEADDG